MRGSARRHTLHRLLRHLWFGGFVHHPQQHDVGLYHLRQHLQCARRQAHERAARQQRSNPPRENYAQRQLRSDHVVHLGGEL